MHIPILIVGGGPAGLTTSILLSRQGIPTLLVERHTGTSTHPKATGISTRTMEIFRSWGIEPQIRRQAIDVRPEGSVRQTLASPEIQRLNLGFPDDAAAHALSPTSPAVLAQDILEPILRDHAQSYSAAELRFAMELRDVEQDSRGVRAGLIDRRTGKPLIVRARYLVAADGAASSTRRLLGVATHGVPQIGRYLSILFRADLDAVIARTDGVAPCCAMYSVVGVGGPTPTVVIPTSRDGRWIVATPWAPNAPALESLKNADVIEIVRRAAGVPDLAVALLDRQLVEIGAEVAERFRVGNVFLVGDAAHRTAPTGATGMNTAIQGAHNLAWKLAAVLRGHARDPLLDSYDVERRPPGERNLLRSRDQLSGVSGVAADLGVVYASAAVVSDDGASSAAVVEPTGPSEVGGRAPHVWVNAGGRRASTIDVAGGRDHLTLMIDAGSSLWWAAAERIRRRSMMPLIVAAAVNQETMDGADHDWLARYGIDSDGAVLIRPDGHIAWRSKGAVFDPEATLAYVLDRVLGFATENVCDLPEIDAELRLRSA